MKTKDKNRDQEAETTNNFKQIEADAELPPAEVERNIMRKVSGFEVVGKLIETYVTRLVSTLSMMLGGK